LVDFFVDKLWHSGEVEKAGSFGGNLDAELTSFDALVVVQDWRCSEASVQVQEIVDGESGFIDDVMILTLF
jgi:hypothetical protein